MPEDESPDGVPEEDESPDDVPEDDESPDDVPEDDESPDDVPDDVPEDEPESPDEEPLAPELPDEEPLELAAGHQSFPLAKPVPAAPFSIVHAIAFTPLPAVNGLTVWGNEVAPE